ncbi:hypothetical protein HK098_007519 [Nowakowskiella sp. JEL0407]|nr:hypothetical protein HK098_007519 [Nowakowskiella sp. JEL0407]
MPTVPWTKSKPKDPPFFGLNEKVPTLLAIILGFQHALAMMGGLVTPPIILSGAAGLNLPVDTQAYMVSAALIACGIISIVQITSFKIPFTKLQLGSGLLSVVGTSFAPLPVAQAAFSQMYSSGFCPTSKDANGTIIKLPCPAGWGAFLGTVMISAWFGVGLSLLPHKVLKRLFPPIVTGPTLFLIGANLIKSAMQNWAGDSGPCAALPATGFFSKCPNLAAPNAAPWGSPQFIGLGFLVFATIIIVELFGSPFMKNAQVIIALLLGYLVAGVTGYVDKGPIDRAPVITFLWVKTFPISIYAPILIPLILVSGILAIEAVGDITATCEVSKQPVKGSAFEKRIQGGMMADGFGSFLSALMTNGPLSTFAQNNGVIAITQCANRTAGYWCCAFLILFGTLGKLGGAFVAIPKPVLGGMTSFLFASVAVAGIRIMSMLKWTRRDRFILTIGLTIGIGVVLLPNWFSNVFPVYQSEVLNSFVLTIQIIMDTGFVICALIIMLLNSIVPLGEKDVEARELEAEEEKKLEI